MTQETKIKLILKRLLVKRKLTPNDILKLQARHLAVIPELKGIDQKILADTLYEVKCKISPKYMQRDLQKTLAACGDTINDQVAAIMNADL